MCISTLNLPSTSSPSISAISIGYVLSTLPVCFPSATENMPMTRPERSRHVRMLNRFCAGCPVISKCHPFGTGEWRMSLLRSRCMRPVTSSPSPHHVRMSKYPANISSAASSCRAYSSCPEDSPLSPCAEASAHVRMKTMANIMFRAFISAVRLAQLFSPALHHRSSQRKYSRCQ